MVSSFTIFLLTLSDAKDVVTEQDFKNISEKTKKCGT